MKLFIATLTALLCTLLNPAFSQTNKKVTLLGEFVLPTGLKINGVEFGGISGLDYDPREDIYYAVSDDRAERGPARFYKLKISVSEKGIQGLDILETVPLLTKDSVPFSTKDVDPETIRFSAKTNSLYWASEGDKNGRPFIAEARLDGSFVREFKLPEAFLPDQNNTRGVRNNLSFESLVISEDGKSLFAGTENALVQDGEKASLEHGSRSRIIEFDIASGDVKSQYAYDTEPIFTKATVPPYWNDNGLSEITTLNGKLLTVERSFALGVGTRINLFSASFEQATDVNTLESLKDQQLTAMKKELFLQLDQGSYDLKIDNIEAITWGPVIAGKKTLVLASDNNFNPTQFTQFIVFSVAE